MRFNFDAQWLAAVTGKELLMLRISVSNQVSNLRIRLAEKENRNRDLEDAIRMYAKLEKDLLKMEETARMAPFEVLPNEEHY